ncbi:chorismate-binding protein [Flaviramulus sp. BrNp1-15]|uniref:chorismate-binding protein n=1 Tax=Flaviramulus sp. BrNp1-15 TaxID=2916754 RepID=UPI001EE811CF|nr:chorismate-binding protein [Flaviramulus sp. BrNp1-15]ULC57979.1 chorismate-binding protein [Flaviramulus sp. BrNp1-15]
MTSEDFFERINRQYNNNLPFVIYRKPNDSNVNGLLQSNDNLFFANNFTEKGFVFSPFDELEKTVLIPSKVSESLCVSNVTSSAVETSHYENNVEDEVQKHQHIELVNKGIEAIKNEAFKKVVLSRQETVNLSRTNPISIFKNLLYKYKSAFVYCWYHPKVGLWLGATPETLIKIEGNRFSIMALAGTQDYKGTLDVVWKNKEKQEQQFVTDFIINNLKPSVESYKVSDLETVKAGNLVHLKTIISAQLKPNINLQEVISVLHPTPAVCGLPKESAKEFILKHEEYNREFYTGFLGELNFEKTVAPRSGRRNIENRAYAVTKKSTQLYVNLRCMQIKDKQAIIYVGGGITESSNAESEWQETVSKSLVIKNVL